MCQIVPSPLEQRSPRIQDQMRNNRESSRGAHRSQRLVSSDKWEGIDLILVRNFDVWERGNHLQYLRQWSWPFMAYKNDEARNRKTAECILSLMALRISLCISSMICIFVV
jgi:hypothetical protein